MTSRKDWPLGASSCVIGREIGYNDEGFAAYARAGIRFAELSPSEEQLAKMRFLEEPEAIVELAAKHGVTFWSFHVPFGAHLNPAILDDEKDRAAMATMERHIRAALRAGMKTVVIHPSSEPNEEKTRQAQMERSIENLRHFAKLCRENGAVLAVEDLPRTCLGNCSFDILTYLNSIPEIDLCFDTNHLTIQSNEDFLQDLIDNGMAGRVRTIHVSDYDFIDERHRLPKDGLNDWEMILRKLEELDYRGVFMYEVSKPWDRDRCVTTDEIRANFDDLIR